MPRAINGMKRCYKCRVTKAVQEFSLCRGTSDGLQNICKSCSSTNNHNYHILHKKKISDRKAVYRKAHRAEFIIRDRRNGEARKAQRRITNAQYDKSRRLADPLFKFKKNVANLIRRSFDVQGHHKKSKTVQILGMSIEQFQEYIQAKFKKGWTLGNQGTVWDLDHIVPVSSASTVEELIRLNHYTNFQPLECHINRYVKRNKLNYKDEGSS